MRSTIIPAQITTVEDKIAGNLNFTQISLLMVPIFITLTVYAFVNPMMHLTLIKGLMSLITTLIAATLAFRIKGKVLIEWALIYFRFSLRPTYYVFNKNDATSRPIDIIDFKGELPAPVATEAKAKQPEKQFNAREAIQLNHLLKDKHLDIRLTNKEGSFHVAYQQIGS